MMTALPTQHESHPSFIWLSSPSVQDVERAGPEALT